ncbi:MAG: cytochrome c oxidase subunit II [Armatimonadota bacterium]|nr:cytochrome c oxidase subunit II [Armatimonadota bacterium]MDR5703534.1 cytochrome c oxidase subunit II [Armatimonadota bacterium]
MDSLETSKGRIHSTGKAFAVVLWILVAAAVLGTIGASRRWWLPPLASTQGADVDRLFYLTLAITSLVFVLVQILLGVFVYRFIATKEERAASWHEHRGLEVSWTLITAVVLTILISMGGLVWAKLHQPPPAGALVVEVTAEQFGWRIRYPGPDEKFGRTAPQLISATNPLGIDPADPAGQDDIVTLNDLRLVENHPVRILIRSKDVIHSFFLPNFRIKQDAVPGMAVEVWFTPRVAGDYPIACAELCGVGHYIMRGQVKVVSQEEFERWLQGKRE